MQAIRVHRYGKPSELRLEECPKPAPATGELLVKLDAVGVNFVDTQQRRGFPAWYRVSLPFTPGFEGAGTVEAVGAGVRDFRTGDRVAYSGPFGAYAEYHAVPADVAIGLPGKIDSRIAAAVLLQGMTAHYLANDAYPIREGDWVLIHAGAGGTGGLLIQMAKARGARVITTVSSEEKAAVARECGADYVFNYVQRDFAEATREIDGFEGLAAVYDSIGNTTFESSLGLLRPRGYMLMYGAASGPVEPFDLNRLNPMGSLFITRPNIRDYVATRTALIARAEAVFRMVSGGVLSVRIGATFSLPDAYQAHSAIESRTTTGKVLLLP
jgi:NADPH2:quinone reductase